MRNDKKCKHMYTFYVCQNKLSITRVNLWRAEFMRKPKDISAFLYHLDVEAEIRNPEPFTC